MLVPGFDCDSTDHRQVILELFPRAKSSFAGGLFSLEPDDANLLKEVASCVCSRSFVPLVVKGPPIPIGAKRDE